MGDAGVGWRDGMEHALYGAGGFFRSGRAGPGGHFRTSVHASALFAGALLRLIELIDLALDHPDRLDVVDVGAGRGELLTALAEGAGRTGGSGPVGSAGPEGSGGHATAPSSAAPVPGLAERLRLTGVEVAPRPAGLPADITWRTTVPDRIVGLLVATEWLDNVPLDVAEVGDDGTIRRVLVDPATGDESSGDRSTPQMPFGWPAGGR